MNHEWGSKEQGARRERASQAGAWAWALANHRIAARPTSPPSFRSAERGGRGARWALRAARPRPAPRAPRPCQCRRASASEQAGERWRHRTTPCTAQSAGCEGRADLAASGRQLPPSAAGPRSRDGRRPSGSGPAQGAIYTSRALRFAAAANGNPAFCETAIRVQDQRPDTPGLRGTTGQADRSCRSAGAQGGGV